MYELFREEEMPAKHERGVPVCLLFMHLSKQN